MPFKLPKVITYGFAREQGMCRSHLAWVRMLYPNGVPLRRRHAYRLAAHGIDVAYFLQRFVSRRLRAAGYRRIGAGIEESHRGWTRAAPHTSDCRCKLRFKLDSPVSQKSARAYKLYRKRLRALLDALNVPY